MDLDNERERLFNSFGMWQLVNEIGLFPTLQQKEEAYMKLGTQETFRGTQFLIYLKEIMVRDEMRRKGIKSVNK